MPKRIELVSGQKFGRLTVVKYAGTNNSNRRNGTWECKCECGNIVIVIGSYLVGGQTKSCGCLKGTRLKLGDVCRHGHLMSDDNLGKRPDEKTGSIYTFCLDCKKDEAKRRYARDKDKRRLKWKQWVEDNKDQRAATAQKSYLKLSYGISPAQLEEMITKQDGLCAICGIKPTLREDAKRKPKYSLHIDHNHVTGVVRELLCWNCNVGLGHFKENPVLLLLAVEYLKKHES